MGTVLGWHGVPDPSGNFHAYHALDNQPWNLCWVIYPATDNIHSISIEHMELFQVDQQPFAAAIRGLCREFSGRAEPQALALWCHLIYFYAQRIIHPMTIDGRLERLGEEVASNLPYPWDINELAERASFIHCLK